MTTDAGTSNPDSDSRVGNGHSHKRAPIKAPPAERPWPGSDSSYSDYADFKGRKTPIIIDNGSWECRAGWATEKGGAVAKTPRLQYPNISSKFRDSRTGKTIQYAGHDATSPYVNINARSNLRTPFESNIVATVDALEATLDYAFMKMGLSGESSVDHPIVMTEPVANLNHSRRVVSELLFEGYNAPSVCYGVDALFAYHANTPNPSDGGLIISSSNEHTLVVPFMENNSLFELVRRISFGGSQATTYFLQLLQAKYPSFPVRVTLPQAERLLYDEGYVSMDYLEELRGFDDPATLDERDLIVQFPFSLAPEKKQLTEEERAAAEEKKKEQGRRLQEQAAKKKEERINEMTAYIDELKLVVSMRETDPRNYVAKLKWHNFRNDAALDKGLAEAEAELLKIRTGSGRHKKKTLEDYENEKPPPTDLLDIPDDTLTPDMLREKRRQRTMKANWDVRERLRKERDEKAAKAQEAARREEDRRVNDFQNWLAEKHERRKVLVEKMRARKKLKQQLQDRRSQASKARMRTVAHLAKDDEGPAKRRSKKGDDDGFGADDADWNVYHEIGAKGDDSDEEAELTEIAHMDRLIKQYDPEWRPDDMDEDEKAMRRSIIYRLAHGAYAADEPAYSDNKRETVAKAHQLHLNVERIKVPEIMFQPSIIGLDQAGIVEIIEQILRSVDSKTQDALMKNVLVTGTHSLYPGLIERLESELRAIRPIGSELHVRRAADPRLDAWKGAAMWAASNPDELKKASITRKEFLEAGEDYLKEFAYSNKR